MTKAATRRKGTPKKKVAKKKPSSTKPTNGRASTKSKKSEVSFEVGSKVPLTDEQKEVLKKFDSEIASVKYSLGVLDADYELKKLPLMSKLTQLIQSKEQSIRQYGSTLLGDSVSEGSEEKWTFFTEDNTYVRTA